VTPIFTKKRQAAKETTEQSPLPHCAVKIVELLVRDTVTDHLAGKLLVPDRSCRILKVIIVRRLITWVLGIWRGRDWRKGWERGGQFTSNLRPRWTDPVTARRVSK
jgi:hypothetical protein